MRYGLLHSLHVVKMLQSMRVYMHPPARLARGRAVHTL
jgi:hypothetical protein